MDVPAQNSTSLVRSAGLPPILPDMFSSKRQRSFYSDDGCDFTSFDYVEKAKLQVKFVLKILLCWKT